jgi:iron complex outermembrane recepter protein
MVFEAFCAQTYIEMTNSFSRLFVFFTLFFLIFGAAHAQKDTLVLLKEVQVQSNYVSAQSAVPHTTLHQKEIKKSGEWRDMPYLLGSTPSVVETSDGGSGVGYTGIRMRGSDPTRINVTINGIPFNDAESQSVYWVNMPDVLASAESVQVQRGIGSSTNGSGSFGGSVHLDLNRIPTGRTRSVMVGLGSFGNQKISFQHQTGLKRGYFASLRGSHIRTDGFVDRASARLNSGHLHLGHIGATNALHGHLLYGKEITYQAWNGLPQQYKNISALYRFNTAGTEKLDTPYANEVDNYRQIHGMLHFKKALKNSIGLQLNTHYTRGNGYFEQYKSQSDLGQYLPSLADTTTDLVRRLHLDNHFWGGTYFLNHMKLNHVKIETGGGLHQYIGNHFGQVIWASVIGDIASNQGEYYRNYAKKLDFNHFYRFINQINTSTSVTLDLQHRFVSYQFDGPDRSGKILKDKAILHFINPKCSVTHQIDHAGHKQLYLFLGRTNREPNRDDYTNSSTSSRPKYEQLYNLETGYTYQSPSLSFQTNAFVMYYKNQLVLNGRINDVGAYTRVNIPKSYRIGIEISGKWQLAKKWSLDAHCTISRNQITDYQYFTDDWSTGKQVEKRLKNTDIAFSPRAVGRQMLVYQIKKNSSHEHKIALIAKQVSGQYLDNTQNPYAKLDAYALIDLQISSRLVTKRNMALNLTTSVHNLLNKKYFSNGWTYRFQSDDASVLQDSYTASEGGNAYNQVGLFAQARLNWFVGLELEF